MKGPIVMKGEKFQIIHTLYKYHNCRFLVVVFVVVLFRNHQLPSNFVQFSWRLQSDESKLQPEILPVVIYFHISNETKDLLAGQHENKRQCFKKCRQYFCAESSIYPSLYVNYKCNSYAPSLLCIVMVTFN